MSISRRARLLVVMILCAMLLHLPLVGVRASDSAVVQMPGSFSISLPGAIDAEQNNVLMAAGGVFALIAPFGDTGWLIPDPQSADAQLSDLQRSAGASNLLWSMNTSTGERVDHAVVGFFPSRIAVNQDAGIVAVRHLGLTFDQNGAFVPQASVSVLKLDAQGHLKLVATSVIPAVGASTAAAEIEAADGAAPDDVFVSKDGRYVFVTNGASIFAYDASQGRISASYEVVRADLYGPDNEITSLTFHAATGTLGAISGNAIYVNDVTPDSLQAEGAVVDPVDLLSLFRFVPPMSEAEAAAGAQANAPAFTQLHRIFFTGFGISAGSNVEFNDDATNCFLYAARQALVIGVDVVRGVVNASLQVDLQARDADDVKSVRTLVYSMQSHTLAIAVIGKRITHPAELARKITVPSGLSKEVKAAAAFARRITVPSGFSRRITVPSGFARKITVPSGLIGNDSSNLGSVAPRIYLISNFGAGNLVPSYSYTNFATGTTISAPQFGERGLKGYFTATDGRLYSFDVVFGTLASVGALGTASSTPAVSEQASRAAILGAPQAAAGDSAPQGGSITVVRAISK